MGVGELVADHQEGGLPPVPGGLEEVLHRGVLPHGGHGDDALVGVGAAHGVQLVPVHLCQHGPLLPGLVGQLAQGKVHLALEEEDLVNGGAGPQGLGHGVAAFDDPVGAGAVLGPLRTGAGVCFFHEDSNPGLGRGGCRTQDRRKKLQGKRAENLHILCIIPWIPGKKKPLSPGIFGETRGQICGIS